MQPRNQPILLRTHPAASAHRQVQLIGRTFESGTAGRVQPVGARHIEYAPVINSHRSEGDQAEGPLGYRRHFLAALGRTD